MKTSIRRLFTIGLLTIAAVLMSGCINPTIQPVGTELTLDLKKGTARWYNNKDTGIGSLHAEYDPATGKSVLDVTNVTTALTPEVATKAADSNLANLKELHAMNNDQLDRVKDIAGKVVDAIPK